MTLIAKVLKFYLLSRFSPWEIEEVGFEFGFSFSFFNVFKYLRFLFFGGLNEM